MNPIGVAYRPRSPAEIIDRPNFVTDYPVQGPTDPGIRAADCWWKNNVLPKQPSCVDCTGGPVPMWTRMTIPGGTRSGVGAAGDPDAWVGLTADQQAWVLGALSTLNASITRDTGTMCPSWAAPSNASGITNASGCFQSWFNASYGGQSSIGNGTLLRVDGVFDEDTLCALITVAKAHPSDFPAQFPDPSNRYCRSAAATAPAAPAAPAASTAVTQTVTPPAKKTVSKGEMAGIAVLAAGVIGGGIYFATRGKKKRRKK
jgi:hypothetical protein